MDRPLIFVIDTGPELFQAISEMLNKQFSIEHYNSIEEIAPWPNKPVLWIIGNASTEMRSITTIQTIKSYTNQPPLLATGKSLSQNYILNAFRAGANDVLPFPFRKEDLSHSINRISSCGESSLNKNAFISWRKISKRFFLSIKCKLNWLATKLKRQSHSLQLEEQFRDTYTNNNLLQSDPPAPSQVLTHQHGASPIEGLISTSSIQLARTKPLSSLNCFLLGSFQFTLNGTYIQRWPGKKIKSLLAYLVYYHQHPRVRDILMEQFWPDVASESARNSLNVAIHAIRSIFRRLDRNHNYLLFKDEKYVFNPDVNVQLDSEMFSELIMRGQMAEKNYNFNTAIQFYERGINIYKGDLLEDDIYEEWLYAERENIKERYLFALDRLSLFYFQHQDIERTIELCEQFLDKDSCGEIIHRRLMKCYYQKGMRNKAIKQFLHCTRILETELESCPSKATIDLYQHIKSDSSPIL